MEILLSLIKSLFPDKPSPKCGDVFIVEGLEYKITNVASKTVELTGHVGNEPTGIIVIPETVNDYSVNSIGCYAFSECRKITSVIIPNGVTTIGVKAFMKCSGLTSIIIPNSVTTIDSFAFYGCSVLTYFMIPNSVTLIGDHAFYGCAGITTFTIPNGVTYIGDHAFDDTGWYKTLSDGIIYLDNWLIGYKGSRPTGEITIRNGTKGIAGDAFLFCEDLITITIPNSVTVIGYSAFKGCCRLTSIELPNSVAAIGHWAFSGCHSLTNITIPNGVTSIGYWTFSNCSGLRSIIIPNSVTHIGNEAFKSCYYLSSITIGNSVTYIDKGVFAWCSDIKDIYCYADPKALTWYKDDDAFKYNKQTLCHVRADMLDAYNKKFNNINVTFVGDLNNEGDRMN